jgi:PAS domain S-box-containing protein
MKKNIIPESESNRKPMARAIFFLGGWLITVALIIGFISYQFSLRMMEQGYQNFYLNKAQMIVTASQPLLGFSDEELLSALSSAWYTTLNRPQDEYLCVVDTEGRLLLHTAAPETVGRYAGDNLVLVDKTAPAGSLGELVATQQNYVGQYISSLGDEQIAAFVVVPGKKWMLGVHRSRHALSAQIQEGFRPLLAGFIIVVGILMPATLFMTYRVFRNAYQKQLRTEYALQESEARYQSLVETMPQCLYRTDLRGKLIYANQTSLRLLGREHDLCADCTVKDLFPGVEADILRASDLQVMQTGCTLDLVLESKGTDDVTIRWLEVVKTPVRDAQGEICGIQGIFWDVTDKKLAEQRLADTRSQLQAIIESVPSGILATDASGILTQVNQKAMEIMSLQAEDIIGQPISEVIPRTGLTKVLSSKRTELGKPFTWGDKTLIVSRSPVINNSGEMLGAVSVFSDQSELELVQRQLEQMRQLNEEFSSLVENSHDGVLITDTNKVLRVNPSFARITGLAPSFVEGKAVTALDQGQHICMAAVKEVFQHVFERGAPLTVRRKLRSQNEIYVTGNPVRDHHGRVVRVVMNIRDVTELESLEEQIKLLSTAYLECKGTSPESHLMHGFVAESPVTKQVIDLIIRVARVDSTILLMGESGVGKDMLAVMIHRLSARHDQPFVSVNCGAIPENLLESEFFGYEKGAFSGADKGGKPGLFEEANGGILFLDEVGELPLQLQVKLLKVLQEQKCRRLGSVKTVDLDVRILAATNRDLKKMTAEGHFREDLFYRLYVVPIEVPPLRSRREDILPLALQFLKTYNKKYGVTKSIGQALLGVFEHHGWPGNVRELQNVVERMVVTADTEVLQPRHLPAAMQSPGNSPEAHFSLPAGMSLRDARELLERQMILSAMASANSTREAAKALGVDHSTVVRKAQKFGLVIDEVRSGSVH